MSISSDLRTLPLFHGISEAHLDELVGAFRPTTHAAGEVLFRPGDLATRFEILTRGEVTLEEAQASEPSTADAVRFDLSPVTPLGELGALTGIPRNTTATAKTEVEIHSVGVGDLLGFFDRHAEVGLAFYKNLLGLVGDKVRRDRRRLEDMRTNIIRTQKAMKKMRETVLAANETELSKPIFETLDHLIDVNRRANYRVMPTPTYPAHVRLDDGREAKVLEVSEGHVKIEGRIADLTRDPSFWTGVLVVPSSEILVSGTVLREGEGGVVVKLDRPLPEFKAKLDEYTTRVQLLDLVV